VGNRSRMARSDEWDGLGLVIRHCVGGGKESDVFMCVWASLRECVCWMRLWMTGSLAGYGMCS
jgi:hypothetical protein